MIIYYSSKFSRAYEKLSKDLKIKAQEKEKIFRADPFDLRLETHKLHGKYRDYWAFTIMGQYRIMFQFSGKGKADFINVGDHDIYR